MNEVYDYLLKKLNLKDNDYVVIGVSGGPDSMALLNLLIELREEIQINIVCSHINHNIRTESEYEANFIKDYCKLNNIIFEFMKIEAYGDDNFHNEARTKRYDFFEKNVKKYKAKYLLTAHHADDLIETILMRITRGSSLKGYSGFQKEIEFNEYKLIRPLYSVTKNEILKYNKDKKIKYVVDLSNDKDKYTRNRYRKNILPFLKKEDPNVHQKFEKFSKTLLEYNDYIEKQAKKELKDVYAQKILNITKYLKLEEIIQKKIINQILESIYHDDLMLISDTHVELIQRLISTNKSNSYIHLPNDICVIKSYNNIFIKKEESEINDYEIELSKFINLPNGKNIEIVEESTSTTNYICRLNTEEIKMPLYVRNRKNGDKIKIKNMLGSKKIKDIFIDEKIPVEERDKWPIVLDSSDTIVWIPGIKKSIYDKNKKEKYDIIIKYY
ncbi:MAG: tRNA lysidine(34) synthetase TilS [Tenericutes bacterium]|nr:tRNA lysidine(34) synthetase TilS [Mycoplasmatota bacterium]